ncbi:MAG: ABC transporter substrate-binding protein [Acetobacteraceae bacterium]|nr:ABC transporter substrate-binding protein [Acetobacteraceae bacterium]
MPVPTTIGRRAALGLPLLGAAMAGSLARPAIAQGGARTLRFVPHANLTSIDPLWSNTLIALMHAYMTCDQLYGLDDGLIPRPQMAEGHELSADRLTWRFTLREGLFFHDGEPVRAKDAVASINRWSKRDTFGKRMAAQLVEMKALDDRRFEIKLNKPFSHLLYGLGGTFCFIYPERIANTDAFTQITDATGSGPYKFVRDEWVAGASVGYVRNEKYLPRQETAAFWSGGKVAHFDKVDWRILPDAATAAAALQKGEVDWLERPLLDLVPVLRKAPGVTVAPLDPLGFYGMIYFNQAVPPFDNPKLRAALLPAITQSDFMQAIVGDEAALSRTGVGMFTPGSPFASAAGMTVLTGKRDLAHARKLIQDSGYKGEKIVQVVPAELPAPNAMAEVARALFKELGLNIDYQAMDWGTMIGRIQSKDPNVVKGWNVYCISWAGLWPSNPGSHIPLYGSTPNPRMDALRDAWFDAPDLAAQQKVTADMQLLGLREPPYIPIGQYFIPHAFRTGLTGFVKAANTVLWGVKKG